MKKMNEFKKRSKARAFATHTTTFFFSLFVCVFFLVSIFFSFLRGNTTNRQTAKGQKENAFL